MKWFRIKRQSIYLYRTRRPGTPWTHNGYVGRTCRLDLRDAQHRADKAWYPLVKRRYVLFSARVPLFLIVALEWLAIKLLMPVYNVQHNRWNPRRVRPGRVGQVTVSYLDLVPVAAFVALAVALWGW